MNGKIGGAYSNSSEIPELVNQALNASNEEQQNILNTRFRFDPTLFKTKILDIIRERS